MGRPRKTSGNVSSPQADAAVPKTAPATPQSSASSKTVPTSGRASRAPASRSEGGRQGQGVKPACAASPRGTGQTCQTRSTVAYGAEQADAKSSRGARSKTAATAGAALSHAEPPASAAGSKTQSKAARPQGKASLPSPLPATKVAEIERETRGQRVNPEWHKWRENRITASVAPKIANSKFVNGRSSEVPKSYLKAVVGPGSAVQTPAMSWGIRNEKKAVQEYEALKSSQSKTPVKVEDCGLFIDKGNSWLAASPDGIVREADTGEELGVLEVKCPYKHRNKTVTEACKDKTFCLEKAGDSYSLKKSHPYYTQVQCQMGVTGLDKADFVVHTNKETAIAPVDFDPVFWQETVPKLEKFYTDAVVPVLEEKERAAVWAKEE
ncbi:uncharacterized protein LOC123025682 [Varanus komodoensis]|uniref:YqaJ viral recombinase domain-containing protein n=1 Tax=Varanus komodoensis TaxID=61221 RepID=A0A8D2LEP9_VARKO|nr:uncharacterized protein LOC123025682 [Varanus komodoensis]